MAFNVRSADAGAATLLVVSVLGIGALSNPVGLRSPRSSAPVGVESLAALPYADARLWEDPLAAAAAFERDRPAPAPAAGGGPEVSRRAAVELRLGGLSVQVGSADGGARGSDPATVTDDRPDSQRDEAVAFALGVSVYGGPYAEDAEQRMRTRYAVSASLAALGYAPRDAEHLRVRHVALADKPDALVAYEDWDNPDTEPPSVRVVWLNDRVFDTAQVVAETLIAIAPPPTTMSRQGPPWSWIGPTGSDALRRLDAPVQMPERPEGEALPVYSAMATDPEPYKAYEQPEGWPSTGARIVRSLPTDDSLAKLLRDELAKRLQGPLGRVRSGRIVLIHEADTGYARSLTQLLTPSIRDDLKLQPETYTYFRGLDGATTGEPVRARETNQSQQRDLFGAAPRSMRSYAEEASGPAQYDYLRRLVERIRDDDARSPPGSRTRAIGLIGTDAIDKVMLLQALRPEFPDAVFFTTDLDARLLDPRHYPVTRNLVIASGYGLRLGDCLQGATPPFRDAYQTSAYLATRLAVWNSGNPEDRERSEKLGSEIGEHGGLLFEVSRSGAEQLDPPRSCSTHPPRLRPPTTPSGWDFMVDSALLIAAGVALLLGLGIVVRASMRQVAEHEREPEKEDRRSLWLCAGVLGVAAGAFCAFVFFITPFGSEPLRWFSGISVWPTVALRVFAAALAAWWCWALLEDWDQRAKTDTEDFRFTTASTGPQPRFQDIFVFNWRTRRNEVHAAELWLGYQSRGQRRARLKRSALAAAVVTIAAILLFLGFRDTPIPARGVYAFQWSLWVIIATAFVGNLLILLVWDAHRLAARFIDNLAMGETVYEDSTLTSKRAPCGGKDIPPEISRSVIDVKLIASRTEAVARSLYYPPVVLFIQLAAMNQIFDNWIWTPPRILVTAAVPCVLLFISAFGLRVSAERARRIEVDRLQELVRVKRRSAAINGQTGSAPGATATGAAPSHTPSGIKAEIEEIEAYIKDIESIRDGAFARWREHAIFRSLLLPGASVAAVFALDWISRL